MSTPARRVVTLLVLLLAALPGLLFVQDPSARDQGVFATIAWQWREGGVPYASAGVEHKGSLPFAAYAAAQMLFGHSIGAARLLAWGALLLTGLLIVGIGRRLGLPTPAATVAGVTYLLVTGVGGLSAWWSGAQAEAFMEPFVAAALLVALGARSSASVPVGGAGHGRTPHSAAPDASPGPQPPLPRPLLAGALLGAATLGKPTALLLAPALLAATGLRAAPAVALGAAVPWLVTLGYFATRGAAGAFVDNVLLVNLDYGGRGLQLLVRYFGHFFGSHAVVVPTLLLVPAAAGLLAGRPRSRVLLLWLAGAYLAVLVQGRFFGYHYHPVVAPLALAAAFGLAARPPVRYVALAGLLAAVATLDWDDAAFRYRFWRHPSPPTALEERLAPAQSPSDLDPRETRRTALWFARETHPDNTVLVWGFEPAVNFLSKRRCPTRFLHDYYLTSNTVRPERRERYRAQFRADIDASPPDYVVIVRNDTNPVESKDSAAQLKDFSWWAEQVATRYESIVTIGDFEILGQRAPAGPPTAPAAPPAALPAPLPGTSSRPPEEAP
jgi:hypothetical protein